MNPNGPNPVAQFANAGVGVGMLMGSALANSLAAAREIAARNAEAAAVDAFVSEAMDRDGKALEYIRRQAREIALLKTQMDELIGLVEQAGREDAISKMVEAVGLAERLAGG